MKVLDFVSRSGVIDISLWRKPWRRLDSPTPASDSACPLRRTSRRWWPHHPVWSKKSCGLPVVVLQEAAQSLLAAHFAIAGTHPLFSRWKKLRFFPIVKNQSLLQHNISRADSERRSR